MYSFPLRFGRVVATGIVILLSPALCALTFRVELKNDATPAVCEVMLSARRIDGDAEPIRQKITVPSSGTLPLMEGSWELRIESDEIWAAPVYARADEEASISAIPAARVRGPLIGADDVPREVVLRLTPSALELRGELFRADVTCPVIAGEMRCTVPAGRYDIRMMPKGFLPQFRWGIDLRPGAVTKLAPLALMKGAAVIGTVVRKEGPLPSDVRVTLVASNAPQDSRALILRAQPNAKGFFELMGVPPGQYVLTAFGKSLTSDARTIVVAANRTAELNAPLVLDTPKRVRATLAPAQDPDGKLWLVELLRERTTNHYEKVAGGSVDADGVWEHRRLADGHYRLTVIRRDGGSEWASEDFHVDGADRDLVVSVPADHVEGSVAFGDRPIAARLSFGGEWGAVRQVITAGDDGSFSGVLPPMKNDLWEILVESDVPPMRRTLTNVQGHRNSDGILQFELALPRSAILGAVVGPDGKPAANAIVNLQEIESGRTDQSFAGPDGSFQFSGIAPGHYRVTAEDYLLKSDVAELEMTDADVPTLHLVLEDIQLVKGRVLANGSVPVIGASVTAISWSSGPPWENLTGQSNEAGAFALRVPPGATQLDLIVAPPGFAAIMARLPVRTDLEMEVRADQHGGSLVADVPADPLLRIAHGDADLWLSLLARTANGSVVVDDRGRQHVSIPSLQAGQYQLCLAARCTSGYVPPHATLMLTLD